MEYRIQNPRIIAYENENPAIADLTVGDGVELDAVMTILPKARAALAGGRSLRLLDEPVLLAYASVTLDRSVSRSNCRLSNALNCILYDLHGSGRLSELSLQYHGMDLATEAARYDRAALNEFPQESISSRMLKSPQDASQTMFSHKSHDGTRICRPNVEPSCLSYPLW